MSRKRHSQRDITPKYRFLFLSKLTFAMRFTFESPRAYARVARGIFLSLTFPLMLFLTACHTPTESNHEDIDQLRVRTSDPAQIREAALNVFHEQGYKASVANLAKMIFEKKGSKFDNAAYGNWVGEQPIWIRIKVLVLPITEGVYQLEYTGYMSEIKARKLLRKRSSSTTWRAIGIANFQKT